MIHFDKINKIFQINTQHASYVMKIDEFGHIQHIYWGKKIQYQSPIFSKPHLDYGYSTNYFKTENRKHSYDSIKQEVSTFGNGDYRTPSLILKNNKGIDINDFVYDSHTITEHFKENNEKLVRSSGKAKRLTLVLKDLYTNVYIQLFYEIYENSEAIIRYMKIKNQTDDEVYLSKAMSFNLDIDNDDFDLLYLQGSWANERHIQREKVQRGIKVIDSKRGTSSHHFAPFYALVKTNTTETQGDVYSFNFVYSGGFEALVEKDALDQLRLQMGIQSLTFEEKLSPNASFKTPEIVLMYASKGLNQMMHQHHDFVNHHILPRKYLNTPRPILINNWEATYFDFTEEKILSMAKDAKASGIELFVLDDGWFGQRNSDTTSLGDWFVNTNKLPQGLESLIMKIKAMGLKFGIWIEPEMISKDSKLYEAHPNFMLKVPNRDATPSRSQYVLDFSQEIVVDKVYNLLVDTFQDYPIDYIKWDMNRYLSDVYSQISDKPNIYHEYVIGVYDLARKLMQRYPNILFEACAGGGGRFDWGILTMFPQVWTSDNTDAIERLKIQDGSVLIFPQSTMGAHISDVPNHQVSRITSLNMRFNVAAPFNLGYELDVSQKHLETIKTQTKHYRNHQEKTLYGQFYRIESGNEVVWQITSSDKKEIFIYIYRVLASPNKPIKKIKLLDLEEDAIYRYEDTQQFGSTLMYHGIFVEALKNKDFTSHFIHLKKEKKHDN